MTELTREDRIGQWFVDATDPTKWYGPVKWLIGECVFGQQSCRGCFGIREKSIVDGDYLRIPPRPDLPTVVVTVCRLPKKGEKYWFSATGAVLTAEANHTDTSGPFGGREWIVADEPEAEKPHGPTCVELTTAFRDIQRLLTEYLVPDGCNAHETITKILAITDTKPFSQLRRETHDETRI
jgi:hypothetical protein